MGDTCERGSQLRPNIVWFGELVPMMEQAAAIASQADIFLVVGTSLVVYPAAGLLDYVANNVPTYIIDPAIPEVRRSINLHFIAEKASKGMEMVKKEILQL
jgi:NAD-dependent deacetylase